MARKKLIIILVNSGIKWEDRHTLKSAISMSVNSVIFCLISKK